MQEEVTLSALPQTKTARGDFVVRRGTFFQIGEYPDKQFGLTEAEADAAIARFAPIPLNVEHIPTIFDGKLGLVRRLWREGQSLLAEYAIPRWLHDVTGGAAIKISSEWSRVTKQPIGGAFVLHPRVADAVMQAAFREEEGGKGEDGSGKTPNGRRKTEDGSGEGLPRHRRMAGLHALRRWSTAPRMETRLEMGNRGEENVQGVAFALDAEVRAEDENETENGAL